MITFQTYTEQAMATANYPRVSSTVDFTFDTATGNLTAKQLPVYAALAMCGEAGEAAEKVKKAWRDRTPLDREGLAKELGDVLWYVTAAATDIGYSLEDIASMNLIKLRDRRNRGVLHGSGDNR